MAAKPLLALLLLGCIWDHDTIRMEREVFPGVQEILAGKFVRHSDAYYEWRLKDRPEDSKDPAVLDDIAVAHEKLGRTGKAIEIMRGSYARDPERYETLANLGTFLIHAGKLEEGLAFIERAIAVNPDAHFGREAIQAEVVRYVLSRRAEEPEAWSRDDFSNFEGNADRSRKELVRGLTGMMFFGRHDSPVLAECLGDVLRRRERRLSCRAYLSASYSAPDEQAAAAYRELASGALAGQTVGYVIGNLSYKSVELEDEEQRYKAELAEGREFFAQIAADETAWAAAGLNLDEQFAAKYYEVGRTEDVSLPIEWEPILWPVIFLLLTAAVIRSVRRNRRRA